MELKFFYLFLIYIFATFYVFGLLFYQSVLWAHAPFAVKYWSLIIDQLGDRAKSRGGPYFLGDGLLWERRDFPGNSGTFMG